LPLLFRDEHGSNNLHQVKEKVGDGSKMCELINLMEGQKTLLDIPHLLFCEFGETDIEYVLHCLQDLQRIGLVEF